MSPKNSEMSTKPRKMLFLLALVLTFHDLTASKVYHIVTNNKLNESTCHSDYNCMTISQFAMNRTVSTNQSLILSEGSHSLTTNLSLTSLDFFSLIHPNSSTSLVKCSALAHIAFLSIKRISVNNMTFVGCTINITNSAGGLLLVNSRFENKNERGTILVLVNTTQAMIDNSSFLSGKGGTAQELQLHQYNDISAELHTKHTVGGAIYLYYSSIEIRKSIFESNCAEFGGAIFAEQCSNVTIYDSSFIGNGDTCQERNLSAGGALFARNCSIIIHKTLFMNNSAYWGGAIALFHSKANITGESVKSTTVEFYFFNNSAHHGGALYDFQGTVNILLTTFTSNHAKYSGGAINLNHSRSSINSCQFSHNNATIAGAEGGIGAYIIFNNSVFLFNSANNWGGAIDNKKGGSITIMNSHFEKNKVFYHEGGAVRAWHDSLTIINSTFLSNAAVSDDGGALSGLDCNFTIVSSRFIGNSAMQGAALYIIGSLSTLYIIDSSSFHTTYFINNSGESDGGAIFSSARKLIMNGSVVVSNNSASDSSSIFELYLTSGEITGAFTFLHNLGSLTITESNIVFAGNGEFVNSSNTGALCIIEHSTVNLNGSYLFQHNHGDSGGAILVSSQSNLYVNARVTINNNTATQNGGGIYLYQSAMICGQNYSISLQENMAQENGGGIFAVSSVIKFGDQLSLKATQEKWLKVMGNRAKRGGGIYLEANSQLAIREYSSTYAISFKENRADYGGALYVDDYSSNEACNDTSYSPATVCFFQIQIPPSKNKLRYYFEFSGNLATKSGATLYGGLLDRCISNFYENSSQKSPLSGYSYLNAVSLIKDNDSTSVTSDPLKVCPCVGKQPVRDSNCTNKQYIVKVKKGECFGIPLAVYDQVGRPLNNTNIAITGYLASPKKSYLVEGQMTRIGNSCAKVFIRVFSFKPSEQLTLFASDGPCMDATLSTAKINLHFLPCSCPVGFQPTSEKTTCNCKCNDDIKEYVTCNSTTESIVRLSNSWISYINETSTSSGYLISPHCPFDYCYEDSVSINLNLPDGEDAQCRFNRTGLLCGSCQPGLSLSLGSSRCLSCPKYWPFLFLFITIAAFIAGIVLVILLLVLNLTVAVGTLNGLIFYANIVAINTSIFLPFSKSNFVTIFIWWLNMEMGIETCYFDEMDAYTKMWLKLLFPAYVIVLVILIIIISHYSIKFSDIIGRRNPVATLATLLLLSYTKILQTSIMALSFVTLSYPDGHKAIVWRPDATVDYLTGKHIVLFVTAIVILLCSMVFTVLVFCWQWLQICSKWKILSWVTNPKFGAFIEVYTVPYTSAHRYWAGLLFLLRTVLSLISALNYSGNPKVVLASVIFITALVLFLRSLIGRVYSKQGIDYLEVIFCVNILSFATFTWLALDAPRVQRAVAYISVVASFMLLLMILLYHIHLYTNVFSSMLNRKYCLIFTKLFRVIAMFKEQPPSLNNDRHTSYLEESLLDYQRQDDEVKIESIDPKSTNHQSPKVVTCSEVEAPKNMHSTY